MRHLTRPLACLLLLGSLASAPAGAGAAIETFDITEGLASPIPGHLIGEVIPIRWDPRCIPVRYSMNTTLDPVPNPLPPFTPVLTLAAAQSTLDASMDRWTDIPTAYIALERTSTTANPGFRGLDMVNELTFRTPDAFLAIASSSSFSFIADVDLADGDDIDGDGDSDVSSAVIICQDADGDGDIEFPVGSYPAGTIIENDVQFNTKLSNGLRFTNVDAQIDTVVRSVDLEAVAVHELGHSLGLAHSPNSQASPTDGTESTMFPAIDTGDPAAEIALRTPEPEELAFISLRYPEGTAATGPAALQSGDVPFAAVYGLVQGEIAHGVQGRPLVGANVMALDRKTRRLVSSAISGTTRVSISPTGGIGVLPVSQGILDGTYALAVPTGLYAVGVEPVDGLPVTAVQVNLTAQLGAAYGQQGFVEEFYQAGVEGALEHKFGQESPVLVNVPVPGSTPGIDVVTNQATTIANFGAVTNIGFINSPPGRYYAIQIPAAQVQTAFDAGATSIQAIEFGTFLVDSSVVPVFAEATLTTGTVSGTNATVDLVDPLARTTSFVGQDADLAAFHFTDPVDLGVQVQAGLDDGSIENLFLVLRIPTVLPFPGVSAQPPLIGLSTTAPLFGFSYVSSDGGVTFPRAATFNFAARLVLSAPP